MKTAIQSSKKVISEEAFIGGLLSQSGYKVVFADIVNEIIDKLNSEKEYKIL